MVRRSGMSLSGGHTPWWRSHGAWKKGSTILFAATVAHGLTGCFVLGSNECEPNTHRCAGGVRQHCEPPCSDIGCSSKWVDEDTCSGTCVELGDGDAECVVSTTPEPRCNG